MTDPLIVARRRDHAEGVERDRQSGQMQRLAGFAGEAIDRRDPVGFAVALQQAALVRQTARSRTGFRLRNRRAATPISTL